MKRLSIPILLFSVFACAMALAEAPAPVRGLAAPEARFVARPNRCAQFLGGDGTVADNLDASYANELSAIVRARPGALERIRAACESNESHVAARAAAPSGSPVKAVSHQTHGDAQ